MPTLRTSRRTEACRRSALAGALAGALLLLPGSGAAAQAPLPTPRASPHASVSQTIGISEVTIDYHRPAVKGRTVWGGLVPWDEVWRAGANENTTFTLSHAARVEGSALPAGTYGLHVLPREGRFTLIFSRNATSWGSFRYDAAEDALRVDVTPAEAPFAEWLAYDFDELSSTSATCRLRWEKLAVPFRIEFDTHAIVIAHARDAYLRDAPGFSWQGWNNAARYCLTNGVELEQGLAWAERSVGLSATFGNLSTQAKLLDKLGRPDEAGALRDKALALATETDINTLGYEHLLAGRLDEALVAFEKNCTLHPDSWNAWDSLAEAHAVKGDKQRALELYGKALSMAPADQHARIESELARIREG